MANSEQRVLVLLPSLLMCCMMLASLYVDKGPIRAEVANWQTNSCQSTDVHSLLFFNALLVTDTQQSGFSCQNLAVLSRMPVAHACNPSYSGGRGQEDHSSIPAKENRSQNPISLIPNTSRAGEVVQVVQFLLASMRS
jgi:hypothetical protein